MPFLATLFLAPPPVTVSFPATRLENALPLVGKAAGVQIATVPAMANEVLLVQVKDVPLEDLLARIAQATVGEWSFDGTTYRLGPNQALRNSQDRAEAAERATTIQASLAEMLKMPEPEKKPKQPGKNGTVTITSAGDAGVEMMGMGNRTLAQIVAAVGVPALASIAPGQRVVFADRPNGAQRQLPGSAAPFIAQYIREHNAGVQGTGAEMAGPEMDQMPEFVKKMVMARMRPIGNPAKTLLVVTASPLVGLQAQLMFLNAEGAVQGQDQIGLGGSSYIARFTDMAKANAEKKPSTKTTPVVYSADSEAMRKAMTFNGMDMKAFEMGIKLPEGIAEKVFHPETYDPLAFSPSDDVTAVVKAKGKSAVAVLPDSMISLFGGSSTVEALEESWQADGDLALEEKDGWLVISPRRPSESRRNRVARPDLAKLLAATQAKGFPSLDDMAGYALNNPPMMENGVSQIYFSTFIPGVSMSSFIQSPWEALRIFARLNPVQRAALGRGEPVPFAGIAGPALTTTLFGATTRIESADAPATDPMTAAMEMFSGGGGAESEPTEIMPQGVPAAGFLTAKVRQEPFAMPVTDGTPRANMAMLGPDELAFFRFFKEDKAFKDMAGYMPKLGKVRIGQRTVWDLQFHVASNKVVRTTLLDPRIDRNSPAVASDALPADLNALIAKRLDEIKKSPMGALGGMMGAFGPKNSP